MNSNAGSCHGSFLEMHTVQMGVRASAPTFSTEEEARLALKTTALESQCLPHERVVCHIQAVVHSK